MVLPEEIPEVRQDDSNKVFSKVLIETAEVYKELGAMKERAKHTEKNGKRMDWKDIVCLGLAVCFLLTIGLTIGVAWQLYSEPTDAYSHGQYEGLLNGYNTVKQDLNQLKQGQGVLFQGEVELAKGIQDINSKIVLNETALQSLNYLNSNCVRSEDGNAYFLLRCKR